MSFKFMAAVTICIDFGAQENKVFHCFHFSIVFSSICHEVMGPDAVILVFRILKFKPAFSLSHLCRGAKPNNSILDTLSLTCPGEGDA